MKKILKKIIPVFTIVLLTTPFFAHAQKIDNPNGFVNDQANIISSSTERSLEGKLVEYERQTSNEIAILTINSLAGNTIEDVAVKTFEDWGIGKKDKDNGVLIVYAVEEDQIRIEVGYGLEGVLTDASSRLILEREMVPLFAEQKYDSGFINGTDAIINQIGDEFTAASGEDQKAFSFENIITIAIIVFIIFSLITGRGRGLAWFLLSMLGRGGGGGGGFGGFGGGGSGGGGSSRR